MSVWCCLQMLLVAGYYNSKFTEFAENGILTQESLASFMARLAESELCGARVTPSSVASRRLVCCRRTRGQGPHAMVDADQLEPNPIPTGRFFISSPLHFRPHPFGLLAAC